MSSSAPCPSSRDPNRWQALAVSRWILVQGRFLSDPRDFFRQLCRQLRRVDTPVSRMACGVPMLHPESQAVTWEWNLTDNTPRPVYRPHGIETRPEFIQSPIARVAAGEPHLRRRLTGPEAQLDFPVLVELQAAGFTDYLVVPLASASRGRYCVAWATDASGGFSEAAIATLFDLEPALSVVLELMAQRAISQALLATYLGADAGQRVLEGRVQRGDSELVEAVLWFADLRDFTILSETRPRAELVATLNDYFACAGEPIEQAGGEILKFIGDAVLGVFRIGERFNCVKTACEVAWQAMAQAFVRLEALNRRRALSPHLPQLRMGAALHVGQVLYGNVGTTERLDFTVIGPAVNLLARLSELCKPLNRCLLLSSAFAEQVHYPLEDLGMHTLRGVREPQQVFGLTPSKATG